MQLACKQAKRRWVLDGWLVNDCGWVGKKKSESEKKNPVRVSYGAPIAVSSECKANSSADCTCDAESAIATSTAIQLSFKKFMTTFFSNKIEGCPLRR